MRIRGPVIAFSISLPLALASCNIYFDEGSGGSNHHHHHDQDAAPQTPDGFPGWGVDATWGWQDAPVGVPPDAVLDDGGFEPDAAIGVPPDGAPDASTCPTPDAAVTTAPDAHTCGC